MLTAPTPAVIPFITSLELHVAAWPVWQLQLCTIKRSSMHSVQLKSSMLLVLSCHRLIKRTISASDKFVQG